jgi:hypothetical protein
LLEVRRMGLFRRVGGSIMLVRLLVWRLVWLLVLAVVTKKKGDDGSLEENKRWRRKRGSRDDELAEKEKEKEKKTRNKKRQGKMEVQRLTKQKVTR